MARRVQKKAGLTLVEVLVSGALTALCVTALLRGFIVAAKITRENTEALRADNVAFDLIWQRFNQNYEDIQKAKTQTGGTRTTTTTAAFPPSRLFSSTSPMPDYSYCETFRESAPLTDDFRMKITVALAYGPDSKYTNVLEVCRANIERIPPDTAVTTFRP